MSVVRPRLIAAKKAEEQATWLEAQTEASLGTVDRGVLIQALRTFAAALHREIAEIVDKEIP